MFDKAPKKSVRGDYDRRWLSDDYFDLIVWYTSEGTVHGFQLCYDKPYRERALTWLADRGFSHMEVDSGEEVYRNQTPILLPDGSFPAEEVLAEFARRGRDLPMELRSLVADKISEFTRRRGSSRFIIQWVFRPLCYATVMYLGLVLVGVVLPHARRGA